MSCPVRILTDPILAESSNGAVAVCPCCGYPVVWFGDARVTLRPRQLRAMLATVREVSEASDQPGAAWGWRLRAKTDREDVVFDLTPDETVELEAMLSEAASALELDALLADVLAGDPL
ncbi:MAG: hypothetical protein AAF845_09705 [Bacteroidota bacterium]